jgi:hypothetical protein
MISNIIIQFSVGGGMSSFITNINKVEKESEKRKDTSLKSLGYSDEEIAEIEREVQAKVTINFEKQKEMFKALNKKHKNDPSSEELTQEIKDKQKKIYNNWLLERSADTLKEKGDTANITPQMVVDTAIKISKKGEDYWKKMIELNSDIIEQNTMNMKNKIIITESQYKRLFLEQSSKQDCLNDADSEELLSFLKGNYSDKNPQIYAYDTRNKTCVIKLSDGDEKGINIFFQVSGKKYVIVEKGKGTSGAYYWGEFNFGGSQIKIKTQPVRNDLKFDKWSHGTMTSFDEIFKVYKTNSSSTPSAPTKSKEETVYDELVNNVSDNNCDAVEYLEKEFTPIKLGHATFCTVMKKYFKDYSKSPLHVMYDKVKKLPDNCYNNPRLYNQAVDNIKSNTKYYKNKC